MNRSVALSLAVIVIISASIVLGTVVLRRPVTCSGSSASIASIMRSQLQYVQFGAIREYELPSGRSPNAIAVAPDGSVWFGEQAVPGVGHLYPNGTLVEYAWPFHYTHPAFTFIWGIAYWDGCVWASDQAGSQLVAVDPNTGKLRTIQLAAGSFPYTMTVGPDGTLWFTEVFGFRIGRVDNQFMLHLYQIPDLGTPAQIVFANDSLAYYVDSGNVGLVEPGIYSFNPNNFSPTLIDPSTRGLDVPTSLALAGNGIWVTEHATSELAYYQFGSHQVVQFPTTNVGYVGTTLPYFVVGNGSFLWFNEHYANRIAVICTQQGTITEYSVSNPPAQSMFQIDNALTLAVSGNRVWFTELSANRIGYIDASTKPNFSVSASEQSLKLRAGSNATINLAVHGESSTPLVLRFADTEYYNITEIVGQNTTALPSRIVTTANETEIQPFEGSISLTVLISTRPSLTRGNYTLLMSVGDGQIYQGVYVTLEVTG